MEPEPGRPPDSPATSSDTVELDDRSGELVQVTLGQAGPPPGLLYGPPPPTLSTFASSAAAAAAAAAGRPRPASLERQTASRSRPHSVERRSQSRQSQHSYHYPQHYETNGYDPFDDPSVEVEIESAGGYL